MRKFIQDQSCGVSNSARQKNIFSAMKSETWLRLLTKVY